MEETLIALLRDALGGTRPSPEGIGDDAALLRPSDGRVVAMDTVVEGTHFNLRWSSVADVAFKVVASNVSDIWAMGARPTAWLLSVGVPDRLATTQTATALADGFRDAIHLFAPDADLIGGDTVRAPHLTLTVTMIGHAEQPIARHTANPGDRLWVNGPLGWSRAGLELLRTGVMGPTAQKFINLHRRPVLPSFDAEAALAAGCSAAMDISDGLAVDLRRLCSASSCGAVIRLPLPGRTELTGLPFVDEQSVDEFQLKGGEDFVLLVAAPTSPGPNFVEIGTVCEAPLGLTVIGADGSRHCLPDAGFEHFS